MKSALLFKLLLEIETELLFELFSEIGAGFPIQYNFTNGSRTYLRMTFINNSTVTFWNYLYALEPSYISKLDYAYSSRVGLPFTVTTKIRTRLTIRAIFKRSIIKNTFKISSITSPPDYFFM